jgi:hypothetical protein
MTALFVIVLAMIVYREFVQMHREKELPWQHPPWRDQE